MRRFLLGLILPGLLGTTTIAESSTVTFAQFDEKLGGQDFVYTNNGANATFNTIGGGSAINFTFQNIANLAADLTGTQNAHLTLTMTTTTSASSFSGFDVQPFTSQTETLAIIRDTAAAEGNGARTNLLSASFTGSFNGSDLGSSGNLSGTTPGNTVVFSSDFVSFTATTQRNLALSFSSINPDVELSGSFLKSFNAAGSGTFASNPAPTSIPEPSSLILIGAAAGCAGFVARARRGRAGKGLDRSGETAAGNGTALL